MGGQWLWRSLRAGNGVRQRAGAVVVALGAVGLLVLAVGVGNAQGQPRPVEVQVDLGEWSVRLGTGSVPAGVPVRLVATNVGTITHALSLTGINARTPDLAPGQTATLDVVFGQAGDVTLFCPVGGGSHRQRGMEASFAVSAPAVSAIQATPAPPPTPTAAVLTGPGANVDRVGLPEDYSTRFLQFYVFDREDNRQVRSVFVNSIGVQVREGQPYLYGTILVMETYRAQLTPENRIALDANGRYLRGDLTGIFVMRKERGFGEKYGSDRTGEWEYVAFRPDGSYQSPPERTLACAQCHLATSDAQRDWVVRGNLFFASRSLLPGGITGLPRTGELAAAPALLAPAAAGILVIALAGVAALRLRGRHR